MATGLDTLRVLGITDALGGIAKVTPACCLYSVFSDLHNEGLVTTLPGPWTDGTTLYEITPAGQAELDRLRTNHEEAK